MKLAIKTTWGRAAVQVPTSGKQHERIYDLMVEDSGTKPERSPYCMLLISIQATEKEVQHDGLLLITEKHQTYNIS